MRIVILTTDNREALKDYENPIPHFGPAPEALLQGFALFPEVEFHIISCLRQTVSSPTKLAPNIFYHPIVVHRLGWMKSLYLGCIIPVRRKLKLIRPDIVHGQGTERDCSISAVFSGFANVITIHGNMVAIARVFKAKPGSFYWIASRLETIALARTQGVFCNSTYTESLVKTRARTTWRVPNALSLPFFTPMKDRPISNCPILVNVGHINPWKRQVEILNLAEALYHSGHKFRIEFYGSCNDMDPYGRTFLDRIRTAESDGYAIYHGSRASSEIVAALDRATGMIHFPSEEAFGLAPAEGLARNLKLFGSKVGGITDIASTVDGAELFDANDWKGLSNSVSCWLRNGSPRPKGAADSMRSKYHPQNIAQTHLDIYREIMHNN